MGQQNRGKPINNCKILVAVKCKVNKKILICISQSALLFILHLFISSVTQKITQYCNIFESVNFSIFITLPVYQNSTGWTKSRFTLKISIPFKFFVNFKYSNCIHLTLIWFSYFQGTLRNLSQNYLVSINFSF